MKCVKIGPISLFYIQRWLVKFRKKILQITSDQNYLNPTGNSPVFGIRLALERFRISMRFSESLNLRPPPLIYFCRKTQLVNVLSSTSLKSRNISKLLAIIIEATSFTPSLSSFVTLSSLYLFTIYKPSQKIKIFRVFQVLPLGGRGGGRSWNFSVSKPI